MDTADLPLEAMLPPDVRLRLEELLKQIEAGKMKAADANAKLKDLQDLLSKIDPSLEPKLAELAKRAQEAAATDAKGDKRSLADRAKAAAANAGMPEDMREQLKELAEKLSNPRVGERQGESQNASASTDAGQLGKSSEGAQASDASMAQAALQLSREAASDPSGEDDDRRRRLDGRRFARGRRRQLRRQDRQRRRLDDRAGTSPGIDRSERGHSGAECQQRRYPPQDRTEQVSAGLHARRGAAGG